MAGVKGKKGVRTYTQRGRGLKSRDLEHSFGCVASTHTVLSQMAN